MSLDKFLWIVALFLCTNISSQDLLLKWENSPDLVWTSPHFQVITDMEEDINGNFIVCGYSDRNINFEPIDPGFESDFLGYRNAFVAKLNPSGEVLWMKTVSYPEENPENLSLLDMDNRFFAVSTDSFGNIYAAGRYNGGLVLNDPNFPEIVAGDDMDVLLVKYDPNGNILWYQAKGSPGVDYINELSVSNDGYLYVGGTHDPGGSLALEDPEPMMVFGDTIYRGGMYIEKLNLDGSSLWLTKALCSEARVNGIEFMSDGNPVISFSMKWYSNLTFFAGVLDMYPNPQEVLYTPHDNFAFLCGWNADIGILKLSESDGTPIWMYEMGGNGKEEALDMKIDGEDNIYVCGFHSDSCDFDPGVNSILQNTNGGEDFFLAKINAQGEYQWHKSGGSASESEYPYTSWWYRDRAILMDQSFHTHEELAVGLGIDENNDVYIAGNYMDAVDLGGENGQLTTNDPGEMQPYVVKYSKDGELQWVHEVSCSGNGISGGILVQGENDFVTWLNGTFSCDVDPSSNEYQVDVPSYFGCYVEKLSDNTCLGDFNGDNSIDSADLLDMLGAFNTFCNFNEECPADLNNDSIVNSIDLLIFLSQIGNAPCP